MYNIICSIDIEISSKTEYNVMELNKILKERFSWRKKETF